MNDNKEVGIMLEDVLPLDEVTAIDWDAVLRDFAWVHALSEQEEKAREIAAERAKAWLITK
ncbi:hypothetical protein EON83_16275 [bacterium]|nr:MAG: hypothetical protein EON83_16275 [bacterium]